MKDNDSKLLSEAYTKINEGRYGNRNPNTRPMPIEQIKNLNTKRLLSYLKSIRRPAETDKEWFDKYSNDPEARDAHFSDIERKDWEEGPIWWNTYLAVKNELKKREHIS